MEDASLERKGEPRPYFVASLEIWGFWKTRELKIEFDRNVNFIIGPNGTGKTTIVNLLSAIISGDFRALDRIDFQRASVVLSPASGAGDTVSVDVLKSGDPRSSIPQVDYKITDSRGKELSSFSLDDLDERLAARDPQSYARRRIMARSVVQQTLGQMVDLSWLSVHRHDSVPGERPDSALASPVDIKLETQANLLVRYLSKLDQRATSAFSDFQKSVFLSLLWGQEGSFDFWDEFDFDVQKEKDDLVPILERFKVQRSRYQSKVDKHFEVLAAATSKTAGSKSLSSNEVVAIVNQRRIHEVVQEWTSTINKQSDIYRMRDAFVRIMNSMFINKDVAISATNEIAIRSGKNKSMPIKALSSGEKQLLIIMSQALLQDCKPSIFIADEPELSLHVTWQERLVDYIRELNPAAQTIFATHSPDIVGRHLDRVIDISKVFTK